MSDSLLELGIGEQRYNEVIEKAVFSGERDYVDSARRESRARSRIEYDMLSRFSQSLVTKIKRDTWLWNQSGQF